MNSNVLNLKNKLGTSQGRKEVYEELRVLSYHRPLTREEMQILDYAQNWGLRIQELKDSISGAKKILNKVEKHIYEGNVIPFARKR